MFENLDIEKVISVQSIENPEGNSLNGDQKYSTFLSAYLIQIKRRLKTG